jgi:hypothetical protein
MKFGARLRSIVVAAGRAARTVARWLTSTIDLRDLFLAAGLILGAYGLSMVYLPAAYIAPAVILIYVALFHAAAADDKSGE